MVELSGSENHLCSTQDYNKVAAEYNQKLRKFSNCAFANMMNFKEAETFKETEEARQFLRSILEHLHQVNKVDQPMNKGIFSD